ncbi:TonB-dependent receptor [Gangjinia marincola]|uniref:TonB-dependent receptor n=1 Tax=Gangjinia marincola TaxID=578463 RepID=A0ABP3XXM3_9FLAO
MNTIRTFFVLLFLSSISFAQSSQVSGTVVSQVDGFPIPGVSVIIKGESRGTVTDFDGNFTIDNLQLPSTLVFSYVGFITQEILVSSDEAISVQLVEDVAKLDEVVVVGYGTQKKKEVTGAVSVVSSETIETLKPARIEQALQGQVAGVNITSSSGAPGAALDIRIRGVSTNGDNRPLILLDGAVIEDLSVVSPGDIENITVLKDATAGIYGVRAANGVILITTKSGRKEMPLQGEFDFYTGFQETTREIPLLNATEYALLRNEALAANGQSPFYTNVSGLGQGTDWQDEVFETAPITNYNLNLRGGTEKSTYALGVSYFNQDGIVGGDKSNFNRYTSRLNLGTELFEDFNVKGLITFTHQNRRTISEGGLGSVLFNALNIDPTITPRQADGSFSRALNYPIEVINPLAQIANTFNNTEVNKLNGVLGANYTFLNNFKATANYQWNYSEVIGKGFFPVVDFGNPGANTVFDRLDFATVNESNQYFRDYTFDAFLNYDNTFNDVHKVSATFGTSIFKTTGDFYGRTGENVQAQGLADAEVDNAVTILDNFQNLDNRIFDTRLLSYFGRIQYDFKERYLFSALVRRDGSSIFGPENKFGIFYAFSAGWIISDEEFFNSDGAINFLKIRGSGGKIGNDRIPAFRFVSLIDGEGTYVFDDELFFGNATGAIANPEIKWEEQNTYDGGVEANFFNNKLRITSDYFYRETEDLLLPVQTSLVTGANAPGSGVPIVNAGSVKNEGIEFQIKYREDISDSFSFDAGFNVTWLDNEVLEVNNGLGFEQDAFFGIGQPEPIARMQVGQPLGVFYGYQTDGIFQTQAEVDAHASQSDLGADAQPGDLRYVDQNGDGEINLEDRTFVGDPIPDATFGLNINFNFKAFDFQSYFFASLGNDIVRNYDRNDPITNKTIYALDRWTGPGSTNENPRVTTGATTNNVFSDYYVEDGSFIRAQNIQLGYSLPENVLEKIRLTRARFYVSVNNLFTLTEYRGYDPAASSGAPLGAGIDGGFYPNPRTFLIGTNLKF